MSPRRSLFGRSLASLGSCVLVTLGACAQPDRLAGPEEETARRPVLDAARQAGPESSLATEAATHFDDLFERILPSFDDQTVAAEVRECLEGFDAAQRADNPARAAELLGRARALFASSEVHPANLGAIRLALARAEWSIKAASMIRTSEPAPAITPTTP